MINDNLNEIFNEIKNGNNFGEEIILCGATKFVEADRINEALDNGLKFIAENKAQEFKEKFPLVKPCNYGFIGYLQTNKVKYLIGKACLIQSCDRLELIEEISKQSVKSNTTTNILIEINIGKEENKHGFDINQLNEVLPQIAKLPNINIQGLMTMLPDLQNEIQLGLLCDQMRNAYDKYKQDYSFKYLSMGISGDYKIAIKHGSNMIRIGTGIFGKRY